MERERSDGVRSNDAKWVLAATLALRAAGAGGNVAVPPPVVAERHGWPAVAADCTATGIVVSGFGREAQAAMDAVKRCNPRSIHEDREFMGAILRHRDDPLRFAYTIGSGEAGQDRVTVRVRIPKGFEIVAFWHTHGAAHWTRQYFSDVDTALAEEWRLPFYMADHSGTLRVFNPGDRTLSRSEAGRLGLPPKHGYAIGTPVTEHPA